MAPSYLLKPLARHFVLHDEYNMIGSTEYRNPVSVTRFSQSTLPMSKFRDKSFRYTFANMARVLVQDQSFGQSPRNRSQTPLKIRIAPDTASRFVTFSFKL